MWSQSHREISVCLTKKWYLVIMKFVEGEKRFWNMLLTLPEGALLPFHEQLMNVPDALSEMYTAPPLCSYIKENKQRNTEVVQQNKCQKIFPWKKMKRRKMFLNRQYGCDIEREKENLLPQLLYCLWNELLRMYPNHRFQWTQHHHSVGNIVRTRTKQEVLLTSFNVTVI